MTTYSTQNPIGSADPRDLYDNAENLDKAVNSDGDTFQDRLGKSRLTWTGIVKAGSGDPAIAVDAAQRAETAADNVEANAAQIAQDAAQQAVMDVVDAVDGAVDRAESAADVAQAAADSAFINADVYPDVATGLAAVADGEQFQVVEGNELVRYRRDNGSAYTEMARYPSSGAVFNVLTDSRQGDAYTNMARALSVASPNLFSEQQYTCSDLPDEVTAGTFTSVIVGGRRMIRAFRSLSESVALRCVYDSVNIGNFPSGKISASVTVHSANTGAASKLIIIQLGAGGVAVQTDEVVFHPDGGSIGMPTQFNLTATVNGSADREVHFVLELNRQASANNDREVLFHSISIADGEGAGFRTGQAAPRQPSISSSANLIDLSKIAQGYRLTPTYAVPEPFTGFDLTDFIEVSGSTAYTSNMVISRYAEYDANKCLIQKTKTDISTFITHTRARFVRLSIPSTQTAAQNLVRSSEPAAFTPYESEKSPLVELDSLAFSRPSSRNLIDNARLVPYTLDASTGQPSYSETIYHSPDYVAIPASVLLTSNSAAIGACFYGETKAFISKVDMVAGEAITAPTSARFVRFTVNREIIDSAFVCIGDEIGVVDGGSHYFEVQNIEVRSDQLSFMTKTDQLIDPSDLIFGYNLSADGSTIVPLPSQAVSRTPVDIPQGETHIRTTWPLTAPIAFLDASGKIITRTVVQNNGPLAIPSGAKRFLYSIAKDQLFRAMLYFGTEVKESQPHGYYIDQKKLPPKIKQHDVVMPIRMTDAYYRPSSSFDYARYDFDSSIYSIEDLAQEWQQLANDHPDYLTRTILGKDASGLYDVIKINAKPSLDNLMEGTGYKLPKILLFSGLHGFEKHSMFDTLLLVKDICENWQNDPVLELLRWNVELVIIPYANPWGFAQGGTAEAGRKNFNGVDLNRNFTPFWSDTEAPSSLYYGGIAPLSEPETQYVAQVMAENRDALISIDHHNHSGNTLNNLTWAGFVQGGGYHPSIDVACKQTFIDTANSFRGPDYGMAGSGLAGFATIGFGPTCTGQAYYVNGIPPLLLETFKTMDGLPRTKALQGCVEVMGNLLVNLLRAFR